MYWQNLTLPAAMTAASGPNPSAAATTSLIRSVLSSKSTHASAPRFMHNFFLVSPESKVEYQNIMKQIVKQTLADS